MAQFQFGVPFVLSAASDVLVLADAKDSMVSRFVCHVVIAGTATVKPQKRSSATSGTAPSFLDTWYTLANTNAQIAAGTTQAATCILDIDAAGNCDVQLVYTTSGGGTLTVTCWPNIG